MKLSLDLIDQKFTKNKEYYDRMKKEITTKIDGRICHHRVVVLNIIAKLINAKTYLEIGVHNGSSMSYTLFDNPSLKCVGVDLFENTISRYSHDHLALNRTLKNITKVGNEKNTITLVQGNSSSPETMERVKVNLDNRKVDLLFIDGDHSYRGIKSDFVNYAELVRKDGIVVIDDYNNRYPEIIKFCQEIDFEKFESIGVFEGSELILRKR